MSSHGGLQAAYSNSGQCSCRAASLSENESCRRALTMPVDLFWLTVGQEMVPGYVPWQGGAWHEEAAQ